jgi:hypothetical protein
MPLSLSRTPAAAIAKLSAASGLPKSEIASLVNESRARAAAEAPALSKKKLRIINQRDTAERLLAYFSKTYPHLFGFPSRPLALGIGDALIARHPESPAGDIRVFLQKWTRSRRYAAALKFNRERFDLDGAPAGEVPVEFGFMTLEKIMEAQRKGKSK